MNILLLSRYDRNGASSRLRTLQYIPYLKEKDARIKISPFFDARYLLDLYAKSTPKSLGIIFSYLKRLQTLLSAQKYDIIWIEKELFPWLPPWAERILRTLEIPYIVDYDDAYLHKYKDHTNRLVRLTLRNKINTIMRLASATIVGNRYLAEQAYRAKSSNVCIIPTSIDIEKYSAQSIISRKQRIAIGWIGTPQTSKYLKMISEPLRNVSKKHDVELVVIGDTTFKVDGVKTINIAWSEASEAKRIAEFDIGIMPLPDEFWERGKCGYKLIQYMACSKPTIASPVGANKDIVDHGENGYLANSATEWEQAMISLIQSPQKRATLGGNGREKVKQCYSIQANQAKLLAVLKSACFISKRKIRQTI